MMQNISAPVRDYFRRAASGNPSVPMCESCGVRFLPPRGACPRCGGTQLGWFEALGARGTVYSLTRTADGAVAALADLDCIDGGGRLLASVHGEGADDIRIGDVVTLSTAPADFELGDRVPVLVRGAS